jgi:hypothetical protein
MMRQWMVLVVCFAVACATSKIDLPEGCRIAGDQGAVVGRLRVTANGRAVPFSSLLGESTGGVFLLAERPGSGGYVPLFADGVFLWALQSGTHRIAGFEYDKGRRSGRVMAQFEVERGVANLVGTLVVDVVGGRFVTRIDEDDTAALNAFQRRCADVKMDTRKRPMRIEEER